MRRTAVSLCSQWRRPWTFLGTAKGNLEPGPAKLAEFNVREHVVSVFGHKSYGSLDIKNNTGTEADFIDEVNAIPRLCIRTI